jgi:hypothetical protein
MPFHFRAEKAIRLGINYLKEVVMKSPIALLVGLFHDLERLNPGVQGLDRDIETIKRRFENEGYGFLAVALPALGQAFVQGLSSGKFTCPIGFKRLKGGAIPRFLSGMLREVFDPVSGQLKETPDQGVLTDLRQVCQFFKKTRLMPDDADFLHHKAVDEFYQCDGVASQVVIPERHDHLIGRVSKLILNTLNSKDVENATYKHGPGAVKEGYSTNQKWLALYEAVKSDDPELRRAGLWGIDESVPHGYPAPDSQDQQRHLVQPRVADGQRRSVGTLLRTTSKRALTKTSRLGIKGVGVSDLDGASRSSAKLISVEKDSSSRRTITVEPMLKQFVQQGLNILLRDSIKECRILRNSLALTDQTLNQKLALEGSQYDNWATIDLKSASDLLSVSLVKSVFQAQEPFLGYMMECRSPVVTCEGKPPLVLGKFAGMGNALTFPVQSVCFAVVCIAAILDAEGTAPSYWSVRRASRRIRVYGDDIIIQRKYAHQCVNWLIAVGLKVNSKKSFLEGNFKESCGVDAFRGVDITPLYIRHRPDQTDASPNVIASFIELSNHLWLRGLYSASACLKNEVERALGRYLPLVSRWSGAFGWHTRHDAQTVHKFCPRTHRFQTRTLALASIKKSDRLDGYAALLKCLSQARQDSLPKEGFLIKSMRQVSTSLFPEPMAKDTDHLDKTSMRYNWRIKQRWVPTREGPV